MVYTIRQQPNTCDYHSLQSQTEYDRIYTTGNALLIVRRYRYRNAWTVYTGDPRTVLSFLPNESFHCVITSPPYFWLRDYGISGQIGLEETVAGYISSIAVVMEEVRRVLRKDGVMFLNLGDTYYSGKGKSHGVDAKSSKRRFGLRAVDKSGGLDIGIGPKSLIGIPWRVAFELERRHWILRSSIIWYRKLALPEAVRIGLSAAMRMSSCSQRGDGTISDVSHLRPGSRKICGR